MNAQLPGVCCLWDRRLKLCLVISKELDNARLWSPAAWCLISSVSSMLWVRIRSTREIHSHLRHSHDWCLTSAAVICCSWSQGCGLSREPGADQYQLWNSPCIPTGIWHPFLWPGRLRQLHMDQHILHCQPSCFCQDRQQAHHPRGVWDGPTGNAASGRLLLLHQQLWDRHRAGTQVRTKARSL